MAHLSREMLLNGVLDLLKVLPSREKPIIVGINGPQGCGKSTLTAEWVKLLAAKNLKAVSISIDDFYLTRSAQVSLAKENPQNTYLQQRGYPGTHDIDLGETTLRSLKTIQSIHSVLIPRYDKSAFSGQGDRMPTEKWTPVSAPLDFVFVEGWLLGFTPVDPENLSDLRLLKVNEELKHYQKWNRLLDAFVQLIPEDPHFVIDWRVEAEERMKAQGKPGMTKEEITDYVRKFLPAYEIYVPHLIECPPIHPQFYMSVKVHQDRSLERVLKP